MVTEYDDDDDDDVVDDDDIEYRRKQRSTPLMGKENVIFTIYNVHKACFAFFQVLHFVAIYAHQQSLAS